MERGDDMLKEMLRVAGGLMLCLWLACAPAYAADKDMPAEVFTRQVAEMVRERMPGVKVEVMAPLELNLVPASGEDARIYLNNIYTLYLAEQVDGRPALLERYIASYTEPLPEAPVKREEVVAVIKGNDWLAEMERLAKGQGKPYEGIYERLNAHLLVFYAQDMPTRMRYLNKSDLEAAGLDRSGLRPLAVGNLKRQMPEIEVYREEVFSMVVAGGTYEASILLFDDFWKGERARMAGPPMVSVPARDLLLFVDSSNPEAVAQLEALTRKMWGDTAYAVSDALFIAAPEGWRPVER